MNGPVWSIWDLDGCLSDPSARLGLVDPSLGVNRYDPFHARCGEDPVREGEASLLLAWRRYQQNRQVAIFTGRPQAVREITTTWLYRHGLIGSIDVIMMRPPGDHSPGPKLKAWMVSRLLESHGGTILFAVEDAPEIVQMYVGLGIPVLQSILYQAGEETPHASTSEG